jgi:hypothetical protein
MKKIKLIILGCTLFAAHIAAAQTDTWSIPNTGIYTTSSVYQEGDIYRYHYLIFAQPFSDDKDDLSAVTFNFSGADHTFDFYGNIKHKIIQDSFQVSFDKIKPKKTDTIFDFGFYSTYAPLLNVLQIKSDRSTATDLAYTPCYTIPEVETSGIFAVGCAALLFSYRSKSRQISI